MLEKLESFKEEGLKKLEETKVSERINDLRKELFGKTSVISEISKSLGTLAAEERKEVGKKIGEIRKLLEDKLKEKEEEIVNNTSVLDEMFDVTLPGKKVGEGALHPITQMCYDLNDAFLSLGFEVYSENDISSEKFAFDNLNFSKDHPARQSMDTFWLEGTEDKNGTERLCLRPHLTGGSVR